MDLPKYSTKVRKVCVSFGDIFSFSALIQSEVDPFIDTENQFVNELWVKIYPCLSAIFYQELVYNFFKALSG